MEIHVSAAGEMLVWADLGSAVDPLFSFGLIRKENSWHLHSGVPEALTMNRVHDADRKNKKSDISIGQTKLD